MIEGRAGADNSKLSTNVIPKGMTYEEMVDGYRDLHHRLLQYSVIAERIRNKARFLSDPQYANTFSLRETSAFLGRFFRRVIAQEGIKGVWQVLRSLPVRKPRARGL